MSRHDGHTKKMKLKWATQRAETNRINENNLPHVPPNSGEYKHPTKIKLDISVAPKALHRARSDTADKIVHNIPLDEQD